MKPKLKPWILTLVLLVTAAAAALPVVDKDAQQQYEGMFERALVTFALARTLNGIISTVQGTELAVQPAGVGLTLTPGQILDPVNDLVERFSWVMLASSVSLGMQQVLLEVSRWWFVKTLVVLCCLLALFLAWRSGSGKSMRWVGQLLVVALLIRFAAPAIVIANDLVYRMFLDSRYQESTQAVSDTGAELERLGAVEVDPDGDAGPDPGGFFGSIQRVMSGATEALDLRARVQRISDYAGNMIEHLIQLCVVFLIQTVVFPLCFLWLLLFWARRIRKNISQLSEKYE